MSDDIGRPVEVLLVEDNPGDIVLTEEAFAEAKVAVDMTALTDGAQALAHLQERASSRGRLPDLILLDLNLPGLDGHGVLRAIRADERLRHLPVIIMTTSSSDDDVMGAYREAANSFITKPLDPGEFLDVVRNLGDYWLRIVELPRRDR